MRKIDTSQWGEFKISDFFQIINGKGITKEEIYLHLGKIIAIQSGEEQIYTSQNVNVLIPQNRMSYYCKKYIATMVFKEGRLHYKAFINELNRHMKTDFTIPLPIDEKDNIDWDYMEKYMKGIECRVVKILDQLPMKKIE